MVDNSGTHGDLIKDTVRGVSLQNWIESPHWFVLAKRQEVGVQLLLLVNRYIFDRCFCPILQQFHYFTLKGSLRGEGWSDQRESEKKLHF